MLGQGLAVACRVNDDTRVLQDGRAGEVTESAVRIVLPSKRLQVNVHEGVWELRMTPWATDPAFCKPIYDAQSN